MYIFYQTSKNSYTVNFMALYKNRYIVKAVNFAKHKTAIKYTLKLLHKYSTKNGVIVLAYIVDSRGETVTRFTSVSSLDVN